ncbi:Uncharacterized protein GBIM_01257, partial [Gryllus bimaculatus]
SATWLTSAQARAAGARHSARRTGPPQMVRALADKVVTMVRCGTAATVAGTLENDVYFWGTRFGGLMSEQDILNSSMASRVSGGGQSLSSSLNGSQYTSLLSASLQMAQTSERVLEPQEILALYASPGQLAQGHTLRLAGVYPLRYSVMVLVDTTVPLARLPPPGEGPRAGPGPGPAPGDAPSDSDDDGDSDSADSDGGDGLHDPRAAPAPRRAPSPPEYDSFGPVPDWIRREVAQSDLVWQGPAHSMRVQPQPQPQPPPPHALPPLPPPRPRPVAPAHAPTPPPPPRRPPDDQ